jgi:hypothetical protein
MGLFDNLFGRRDREIAELMNPILAMKLQEFVVVNMLYQCLPNFPPMYSERIIVLMYFYIIEQSIADWFIYH